jgi:hypothetical protein
MIKIGTNDGFRFKTDTLADVAEGQQIVIIEPAYYGGQAVAPGDEAFIWFSGSIQRLAWSAEVMRVDTPVGRRTRALVRLIARAGPDALGIVDLLPYRDVRDGTPLSELARKLYFFADDKVACLTPEEADLLRGYFQ